jgi:hypothetical protein
MTIPTETAADITIRVAPPAAVAAANAIGVDVPMLINLIMFAYMSVLLTHKLWTIYKDWREGRMRIIVPEPSRARPKDTDCDGSNE